MKLPRFGLWVLLIAVLLLSTGCAVKPRDVTHDPSFGNFGAIIGTWKCKAPLRLMQGPNNLVGREDLGGGLTIFLPDQVLGSKDYTDLGILPVGTEVRIEHLYYWKDFETSYMAATGSLTAGPYKDRPLELNWLLFEKDLMATVKIDHLNPGGANIPWTVNSDVLEK